MAECRRFQADPPNAWYFYSRCFSGWDHTSWFDIGFFVMKLPQQAYKKLAAALLSLSAHIMEFHVPNAVVYTAETLIIWDYLISIDDEVALFWSSRRSWIKFLFFLNRYLGIFLRIWDMFLFRYNLDLHICGPWKPFKACYLFIESDGVIYVGIQLIVLESIMVIRAWAIMGRQCRVLWTFLGLLTLSTIASLVLYVLPIESASGGYYFYFLPTVFLEVILFAVVAYHSITYLRNLGTLKPSCSGVSQLGPRPIMWLMFKDSIFYFAIIISVLIIMPLLPASQPLCMSVASITATHMLLRLRKQTLSDSAGQISVQEDVLTFRAVPGGINSSSEGEEDISF